MSILKIAQMGHPVLRKIAEPLAPDEISSAEVQAFIDDLLETCLDADGAGLAAPQVHSSRRIVCLALQDDEPLRVWINPVVTPLSDDLVGTWEGCLSVEGMRALVYRPDCVRVDALDRHGAPVHLELSGFPAIVAQHECDHLDGVLYVDRCEIRTLSFLGELRRHGPLDEEEDGDDVDLEGDDLELEDETDGDEED